MKHRWIKLTLLISLAVNIATVVFVLTFWSSNLKPSTRPSSTRPRHERPPSWVLPEKEDEVENLMHEYTTRTQHIKMEFWGKRRQLIDLLQEGVPDTAKIMRLIDELAVFQTTVEKITARQILKLTPYLDPEKRDIFIRIFEERMMQVREPRGEGDRGRSRPDSSSTSPEAPGRFRPSRGYSHSDMDECMALEKLLNAH